MQDERRDVMAYLKGWATPSEPSSTTRSPTPSTTPSEPMAPMAAAPGVVEVPLDPVAVAGDSSLEVSTPVHAVAPVNPQPEAVPAGNLRPRAPGRRPGRRSMSPQQRREFDRLRARGERATRALQIFGLGLAVIVVVVVAFVR